MGGHRNKPHHGPHPAFEVTRHRRHPMPLPLLLVASLAAAPPGVQFVDASFDAALESAARSKKLVFVDFYTDW